MKREHKVVWICTNIDNVARCPVSLVDKYIGLCPPYYRKNNFYLRSVDKPNPAVWYAEQEVGINTLKKTIKRMLAEANIEEYYTNHSLHRTGGTRLFNAAIERNVERKKCWVILQMHLINIRLHLKHRRSMLVKY